MNARIARSFFIAVFLLGALTAGAREVLTPEEQAERELERRRNAPPVLECTPKSLVATVEPGETTLLHLTVRNAGGLRLRWSVLSAPKWVRLDRLSGKLGFEEEDTLVLVADPGALPRGAVQGRIVIAAPGAEGSPVTIAVALAGPAAARPEAPAPVPEPPREEAGAAPVRVPSGRVRLGLEFRAHLSELTGDARDTGVDGSRFGSSAGVCLDIALTDRVTLGTGVFYTDKGGEGSGKTVILEYVEVPILARLAVTERLRAVTGLTVGFNLLAETEIEGSGTFNWTRDAEDVELCLVLGGEVGLRTGAGNLLASFQYSLGLTDIDATATASRTSALSFGLAYTF